MHAQRLWLAAGLANRGGQRGSIEVVDVGGGKRFPGNNQLVAGREDRDPRPTVDRYQGLTKRGERAELERAKHAARQDQHGTVASVLAWTNVRCFSLGLKDAYRSWLTARLGVVGQLERTTAAAPRGTTAPVTMRNAVPG